MFILTSNCLFISNKELECLYIYIFQIQGLIITIRLQFCGVNCKSFISKWTVNLVRSRTQVDRKGASAAPWNCPNIFINGLTSYFKLILLFAVYVHSLNFCSKYCIKIIFP